MGQVAPGSPLGASCFEGQECASGYCLPFYPFANGVCSECDHDSVCMVDGGPGTCTLVDGVGVCSGGEAGTWCESDEACAGELICVSLNPDQVTQCSECATDDDCQRGLFCGPTFGLGTMCLGAGVVVDGEECLPASDFLCASTHCGPGGEGGTFVCGECVQDEDCAEGQACLPAQLDGSQPNGVLASRCV